MVRSNMLCLLRRLCCAVSEVTETRHSIVCPFARSVAEDCPSVGNGGDPYSFSVTLLSDRVGQDWRVLKVCSVMMFVSVPELTFRVVTWPFKRIWRLVLGHGQCSDFKEEGVASSLSRVIPVLGKLSRCGMLTSLVAAAF